MINDRQFGISLTAFLAWLAWAGVVLALVLAWLFPKDRLMLSQLGLGLSAAAATLHMRSFLCVFGHRMAAAFELGREVERQHQQEKALRSV